MRQYPAAIRPATSASRHFPGGPLFGRIPGQNSPWGPRRRPPVQNSPRTAKNTHFSPFKASREKIIPVQTQTTDAGRIFSRIPPPTSHAAHTRGTKLSRHTAFKATTGTKLSPHSKKHPFQPIQGEQGENYPGQHANNRRRENFFPQLEPHPCFAGATSLLQ